MKLIIVAIGLVAAIFGAAFALGVFDNESTPAANNTDHTATNHQTDNTSQPARMDDIKSGQVAIDIKDMAFTEAHITVRKGSTVTWTNRDGLAHTVTSDDDSANDGLNSPLLQINETYSFTFTETGTYEYHCVPHPTMTGSITVVE